MLTMPSFVYLIPAVMLFGLGKVPAFLAIIIYAVPRLIRLTDVGIRQVDGEVVEAATAFIGSPAQFFSASNCRWRLRRSWLASTRRS